MEIKYHNHTKRKSEARAMWNRIGSDYNNGLPASKIAKRYTNPKTGKPYTREHIYYILRQLAGPSRKK